MLDILYDMDPHGSKFLVEMVNEKLVCIWCFPTFFFARKTGKSIKEHNTKPVRCFISINSPTKIYELFKLIKFRH